MNLTSQDLVGADLPASRDITFHKYTLSYKKTIFVPEPYFS